MSALHEKMQRHAPVILGALYKYRMEVNQDPEVILVPFEVPDGCTLYGIRIAQSRDVSLVGPRGTTFTELEL